MATTNAQYCAFFWNEDQANPCDTWYRDAHPLDHLHRNSAIVNNRVFENAIVKIQGNAEGDLTNIEKSAVAIFKIPTTEAPVAAATPPTP